MKTAEVRGATQVPPVRENTQNETPLGSVSRNRLYNLARLATGALGVLTLFSLEVHYLPKGTNARVAKVAAACGAGCIARIQHPLAAPEIAPPTSTATIPVRPKTSVASMAPPKPKSTETTSAPATTTTTTIPRGGDRPHLSTTTVNGADKSWPDNNAAYDLTQAPVPLKFIDIGVNNGRPYTVNPHLQQEIDEANKLNLNYEFYMNTEGYRGDHSYNWPISCDPTSINKADKPEVTDTLACQNYDFEFNAVGDAAKLIRKMHYDATKLSWLDVEGGSQGNWWSANVNANKAALRGALDALHSIPTAVAGIYSNKVLYDDVTGGWENNVPVWIATGQADPNSALGSCDAEHSFTAGPVIQVQWQQGIDFDTKCPPATAP